VCRNESEPGSQRRRQFRDVFGIGFCDADQIRFIFELFAEATFWIACSPELALKQVRQSSYAAWRAQNCGKSNAAREILMARIDDALDAEI
jgi:hypothetical protein